MFRVLAICTANHCRSPMCAALLNRACDERFGPDHDWQIGSAGTNVPGPIQTHRYSVAALAELGVTAPDRTSRQMTPAILADADLILASTRVHRSAVITMLPAAVNRSFTVLQLARLAGVMDPLRASRSDDLGRQLLSGIPAARARLEPIEAGVDDLPDPIGQPMATFRSCALTLSGALSRILEPLYLTPSV